MVSANQPSDCRCPCCAKNWDWDQPPLNRQQAARALGLSIESLFKIRKQYGASHDIDARHRGNVVFYRNHIDSIKEILKWENERDLRLHHLAGIRSGKSGRGATISALKGKGFGGRRASAVQTRLK